MCGTKIENGKCSCGEWKSAEEEKDNPFKLSLEKFYEMKQFCLSSDAPHLGVAAVFFRGDYVQCQQVIDFIKKIKGRPYYYEVD